MTSDSGRVTVPRLRTSWALIMNYEFQSISVEIATTYVVCRRMGTSNYYYGRIPKYIHIVMNETTSS